MINSARQFTTHSNAASIAQETCRLWDAQHATGSNQLEQVDACEVRVPTDRLVCALPVEQHLDSLARRETHHGPLGKRGAGCHRQVLRPHELVEFRANPATEPLYIINPFAEEGLAALFVTHPPVAERVRRLRALDPAWREKLRAA